MLIIDSTALIFCGSLHKSLVEEFKCSTLLIAKPVIGHDLKPIPSTSDTNNLATCLPKVHF
jgi:hypothetical protein